MSWFTPKCPIDPDDKKWIEESLQWLLNEFGADVLHARVILPTPAFFPDTYSARKEDARRLVDRVCGFMAVDPQRVELEFYTETTDHGLREKLPQYEWEHHGTAGHYRKKKGKVIIGIEASHLKDTMSLVGTVAHELGHELLLGDRRISPSRQDHEPLTDLLTVFFGMGIFTANSAFVFSQFSAGSHQGWSVQTRGYMTESMFGYSLALFAWLRGESEPDWAQYLNDNILHYFKKSLKYLKKTGDSSLKPENVITA